MEPALKTASEIRRPLMEHSMERRTETQGGKRAGLMSGTMVVINVV